jgi:ribonuclease E
MALHAEAGTEPEMAAANDDDGETDALSEAEPGDEIQPTETQDTDSQGRRRRRGRRGGRRRRRGPGQEGAEPEQYSGDDRAPRLQLELRPGEPGYSGPAEEFGEESDLIAAEEVAEGDVVELTEEAPPHEAQPVAAESPAPAPSAAKETPPAPPPAASDPEPEAERTPVTYNVSPPHDVSGPVPNPRRGWWRR